MAKKKPSLIKRLQRHTNCTKPSLLNVGLVILQHRFSDVFVSPLEQLNEFSGYFYDPNDQYNLSKFYNAVVGCSWISYI